mgnify:CR=1 FL=1
MTDKFESHRTGLSDPGTRHFLIVPSDTVDIDPKPRALYCRAAGTVVIRDEAGVDLPYTMNPGDQTIVRPVRVLATGTTGTYYGVV